MSVAEGARGRKFVKLEDAIFFKEVRKSEIARRQIDGAIREFFRGGDPVVLATLLEPASQILRDLNKNGPGSISTVLTELCEESGHGSAGFWKEWNAVAAKLKHARVPGEVLDIDHVSNKQVGRCLFCITEYSFYASGVTRNMDAFCKYIERSDRRSNRVLLELRDALDRRVTLWRLDAYESARSAVRTVFFPIYKWSLRRSSDPERQDYLKRLTGE